MFMFFKYLSYILHKAIKLVQGTVFLPVQMTRP